MLSICASSIGIYGLLLTFLGCSIWLLDGNIRLCFYVDSASYVASMAWTMLPLCCSMLATMAWTMWFFYGLDYAFAYAASMIHLWATIRGKSFPVTNSS
jgi:hypothetical protein